MSRRRLSPACSRTWTRPSLFVLVAVAVLWLVLPYDSVLRLSVRFNSQRALNHIAQPPRALEHWLTADAEPYLQTPNLYDDVGVILKTGYGTQRRVSAQIDALGLKPLGADLHNMIVISDFTGTLNYSGGSVTVHDAIAPVLKSGYLGPRASCARGEKYRALTSAVQGGDVAEALRISKEAGWELDSMKFIPGLELAYAAMPDKRWYLFLDDDTYVIPASLRLLMGHLDPFAEPLYIGNAVGDFKGRFAHGGSAIVLSASAVRRLLDHPAIVHQAYIDSVTETWGDKLLATTLMKVGVYLDERFTRLFNGARPRSTRISADRFCLPLISFHGLAKPELMAAVGDVFDHVGAGGHARVTSQSPILWGDLWALYGRPTIDALLRAPVHRGLDFVGRPGDDSSSTALSATRIEDVRSAEDCRIMCDWEEDTGPESVPPAVSDRPSPYKSHHQQGRFGFSGNSGRCLAWSWDARTRTCTTAPWFVVGEEAEATDSVPRENTDVATAPPSKRAPASASLTQSSTYSGVNAGLLRHLLRQCVARTGVAWAETEDDVYELVYEN